ncbi:MAG: GAF domain-containing protein, partial [Bacteroidota bacterium]
EDHLSPYKGLKYPASDIPPNARMLYQISWVRLIGATNLNQVNLYPRFNPLTHQRTNLSTVVLRAVSPCHLEYLQNMGVGASMSIAINVNDKLWGLIACHHGEARWVSHEVRRACILIGQVFSGHMTMILSRQTLEERGEVQRFRTSLHQQVTRTKDLSKGLLEGKYSLLDLVECSGAALRIEGNWETLGLVPDLAMLDSLMEWIPPHLEKGLYATDHLPDVFETPIGLPFAGLLAIEISRKSGEYIFWFRQEQVKTVAWGGKPGKIAVQTAQGLRLHPRKSFAKWTELVKGMSHPWRPYEIQAARDLRENIISTIIQDFGEQKALNAALKSAISDLETFSYS